MRIIGEISHAQCKVTLYHWNNRYLIKVEKDRFEQTFKIDQFDLTSEAELKKIVNDDFIQQALNRFDSMEQDLSQALQTL